MPFNGSGVFQRVRNWVADATAGIKIRADYHDSEDDGFAAGLSNCITKDGQTIVTQNIPMNSKRITGLADPINPQDALTKAYSDSPATGKVSKTGDTMTGALVITTSTPHLLLNSSDMSSPYLGGQKNAKDRWAVLLGNSAAESTGNVGSDFNIYSYDDAGAYLATPLAITRANGAVAMSSTLTVTGIVTASSFISNAGPATGAFYFGDTTRYVSFESGMFHFIGGPINFTTPVTATVATSPGVSALFVSGTSAKLLVDYGGSGTNYYDANTHYFRTSAAVSILDVNASQTVMRSNVTQITGGGYNPAGVVCALNVAHAGGGTAYGIATRPNVDGTVAIAFMNAANALAGSINQSATGVGYNTASDERMKEDPQPFDAGPIIDKTAVYDFAWKNGGKRAHGVFAQQAEKVFPGAVTYVEEQDWWGVDYSKYVPLLLQEVKALRARVTELEAGRT